MIIVAFLTGIDVSMAGQSKTLTVCSGAASASLQGKICHECVIAAD